MGAHDQAIASGQRALALATALGDLALQVRAASSSVSLPCPGDYRRAIGRSASAMWRPSTGDCCMSASASDLPAVFSRAWLAWCHAELGRSPRAGSGTKGSGLPRRLSTLQPDHAYCGIGLLSLRQGDLPRAIPVLERALGLCQGGQHPRSFPRDRLGLGCAYALAGASPSPAAARAGVERTATERLGCVRSLFLAERGTICWLAARRRRRRSPSVRSSSPEPTRNGATRPMPCASSARSPHIVSLPEVEPAEAHYQQALALAEELGMRPLQAHCHRGLGTLYPQTRPAGAGPHRAVDGDRDVPDMEMTFWLPETEAALAQVEGR